MEVAGFVVEKNSIVPPQDFKVCGDSGAIIHFFRDEPLFPASSLKLCDIKTISHAGYSPYTLSSFGEGKI